MSKTISSKSPLISTKKTEYRCPQCSLVPFIKISTKDNQLFITSKCVNNHPYSETFEKMDEKWDLTPISNCTCATCENENKNKIQKLTDVFYYCSKCFKFFCLNHGKTHGVIDGHKVFLNNKFDSICTEHDGTTVVGYCTKHNKNYCMLCEHFQENNKKFDEKLNKEKINYYEKEMQKNEVLINELESLFDNYKKLFENLKYNFILYKQNINKKIKFMKDIINFYKNKELQCDINFQMKANIQNNIFNLSEEKKLIANKLNEQIKEINEFINLIKTSEEYLKM